MGKDQCPMLFLGARGWQGGRRAKRKAPRSFEESGVGNGRWMEGPVGEDMLF
jgi:hypothetical protein